VSSPPPRAPLPPLVQDVYDRLATLGIPTDSVYCRRILIDFNLRPELSACSELFWRIFYLTRDAHRTPPVSCTVGERRVGVTPIQEIWDMNFVHHPSGLVELAHEGVTVESVLEGRLRKRALAPRADLSSVLSVVEDSLLYLNSPELTGELVEHATAILHRQTGTREAPAVVRAVQRFVHHYRLMPRIVPEWLTRFAAAAHSHYATLLPSASRDRSIFPEEMSAAISSLFILEKLVPSCGRDRGQLAAAIGRACAWANDPVKSGLLWSAECRLGTRNVWRLRASLFEMLDEHRTRRVLPAYIRGFLLAHEFAPVQPRLAAELVSKAFERLPDEALVSWLPRLIVELRRLDAGVLALLVRDAFMSFPRDLSLLLNWEGPWESEPEVEDSAALSEEQAAARSLREASARALCVAYPASMSALASMFEEAPPPQPWPAS